MVAKKDGIRFHSITYKELISGLAKDLRPIHGDYIRYLTESFTRPCRFLARQNMSFCEAAPPPGRLTLYSGIARSNSTSSSAGTNAQGLLNLAGEALGFPPTVSQGICRFYNVLLRQCHGWISDLFNQRPFLWNLYLNPA